tara:strand:- start:24 stop:194 length:171 start_codon:yes stop_codon:yes gene_type:complete
MDFELINTKTGIRGYAVKYYESTGQYLVEPRAKDIAPSCMLGHTYMLWEIEETEVI